MREDAIMNPGGNEEFSQDYLQLGYVAFERDGSMREKASASITLERAFDDWCLAQMAKALGKDDDYNMFMKRSLNYRNHFDASVGFMRPRHRDGSWKEPFDAGSRTGSGYGFTESNSWQMTWFVPHDIQGLIQLMNGREKFIRKLDIYFKEGHHNQGNEPGFINPFLFDYAGAPWKTQEVVSEIMEKDYGDGPGGLRGNDDSGALSAWLVFSAMDFYPVCPGSNIFVITSPLFEKVTICADNKGRDFVIEVKNVSEDNKYILSSTLNGLPLNKPWITYSDIVNGSQLVLFMGDVPNKKWGSSVKDTQPFLSKPVGKYNEK